MFCAELSAYNFFSLILRNIHYSVIFSRLNLEISALFYRIVGSHIPGKKESIVHYRKRGVRKKLFLKEARCAVVCYAFFWLLYTQNVRQGLSKCKTTSMLDVLCIVAWRLLSQETVSKTEIHSDGVIFSNVLYGTIISCLPGNSAVKNVGANRFFHFWERRVLKDLRQQPEKRFLFIARCQVYRKFNLFSVIGRLKKNPALTFEYLHSECCLFCQWTVSIRMTFHNDYQVFSKIS